LLLIILILKVKGFQDKNVLAEKLKLFDN